MDQFIGLAMSSAIFFAFVAYSEARDLLQSSSPGLSLSKARLGGIVAGASTLTLCVIAFEVLTAVNA